MVKKALFSSDKEDWGTPQNLFDNLNKHYSFSLDVCASEYNHKVHNYFDIEKNGLEQSWEGETCWMNPPYGKEIGKWVEKAFQESQNNNAVVVCLLPVRTDTRWWQNFCSKALSIMFIKGRLKFEDEHRKGRGTAPFPSAVVVFSDLKKTNPRHKLMLPMTFFCEKDGTVIPKVAIEELKPKTQPKPLIITPTALDRMRLG